MNRKLWHLVDGLFIGVILAYALPADALERVAPPTDWTGLAIAFVVGAIIVAGIWFLRHNPGSVAKAKAEAMNLTQALNKLTDILPSALASIPPGAVPAPPPPVEIVVAGKSGVPGRFAIDVTGDPAVDLPAINSQYFGQEKS